MKYTLGFLLATVCFSASLTASAMENQFRCHGRSYESDYFFKYEVELHDNGPSRVRLITSQGYSESTDYGWRQIETDGRKIPVDTPYVGYKAFISRMNSGYELILVDPITSVPIANPPYDRFVCVNF
ncbi:MAG: hypothetical protein J7501_09225 [Bdellovibrio sp.]|nr:hypothetical protein [Bdellovibrio sp.]